MIEHAQRIAALCTCLSGIQAQALIPAAVWELLEREGHLADDGNGLALTDSGLRWLRVSCATGESG